MDTSYTLDFAGAAQHLKNIVHHTPLMYNANLSRKFECSVYLKREDLQVVRSYKLRGAYNMISRLSEELTNAGVVCASAGNHAQGVAYSCSKLGINGVVFMPVNTPQQKIGQTKMFGGNYIEIRLSGDTFDDCAAAAKEYCLEHQMTFIPPFDDWRVIEGQGTVAVEILEDIDQPVDYLFVPIGGGGLAAGTGAYFKASSPDTKIIGLEPEGAPSMLKALENGAPVTLDHIDRFVDGAAVKRVGDLTFSICKDILDDMHLVSEGSICSTILQLYNEEAIVAEPAGALSVAALEDYREEIKGKTVVCVVSGSNNDISRMQEIRERALLQQGLKHYLLVSLAQRAGAVKKFINEILGPEDNIVRFEYKQKNSRAFGQVLIGIEVKQPGDYQLLLDRMKLNQVRFIELNNDEQLFGYLI